MSSETYQAYRHSGRFGAHGPILTISAVAAVSLPLGYAYAYLVKWIPFIYLNFLLTAGYGFVIGFVSGHLLKMCKVRNNMVMTLSATGAAIIALFFAWNAHVHAVFDGAPWLLGPADVFQAMKALYEDGSWGMRSGGNVTGILLGIVWLVEAGIIVALAVFIPFGMLSDTPFCERAQCWLDQERKIDTIDAFTDPAHLEAFAAGDLGPLAQARPRNGDSPAFGRLTVKHSPRCEEFCTVSVANVTLSFDKDGNRKETTLDLARNLMLPKSMLELITKFENFNQLAAAQAPAASETT